MLFTHLFTPLALTRSAGLGYSTDLDARLSGTCAACTNSSTYHVQHCLGRSIHDHLDYGVLPFVMSLMFQIGTAEPMTQRLFPIEIVSIGQGFIASATKLVTKRSGVYTAPSLGMDGQQVLEISRYVWAALSSRKRVAARSDGTVHLELAEDEAVIVEAVGPT